VLGSISRAFCALLSQAHTTAIVFDVQRQGIANKDLKMVETVKNVNFLNFYLLNIHMDMHQADIVTTTHAVHCPAASILLFLPTKLAAVHNL
jgi:hypothetical protein